MTEPLTDPTTFTDAELSAAVAREFFRENVEQIEGRWYLVYAAGRGPGAPWVWPDGRETHEVPRYAADIKAAWEVVGALGAGGYLVTVRNHCTASVALLLPLEMAEAALWECELEVRRAVKAEASTAARAICLAALAATRAER